MFDDRGFESCHPARAEEVLFLPSACARSIGRSLRCRVSRSRGIAYQAGRSKAAAGGKATRPPPPGPRPRSDPSNAPMCSTHHLQLLGRWHLSLLLLADRASTGDGLLDESLCAGVDLMRTNGTMLRLDWQLHQMELPAGLADVQLQVAAAILGQPGLWALATPLGGERPLPEL